MQTKRLWLRMITTACGLLVIISLAGTPFLQAWQDTGNTAKTADDRPDDRQAIRAMMKHFVEAFEQADIAKITSFVTEGAVLINNDAPPVRGRGKIQEALKKHFADGHKQKMAAVVESLHFTSRDTAVEEGVLKTSVNNQAWASHRYCLNFVREDGKWLITSIKESPSDDAPLDDLEWLIGNWQASRADISMQANYEWIGNKAFIRGNITVKNKDRTIQGMQVLGLHPKTNVLTIWLFEADGGLATGTCTRDGSTWTFETEGSMPDGTPVANKNILHFVNNDTITWQPVKLVMGEQFLGDLPPLKVTRVRK